MLRPAKYFEKTALKQARLVPLHFDKSRKRTLCRIGNHLFHIIKGKNRFKKYQHNGNINKMRKNHCLFNDFSYKLENQLF